MDQDEREFLDQMFATAVREFARLHERFDRLDAKLDRIGGRPDSHDSQLHRLEALSHDMQREMKSGFAQICASINALGRAKH